MNIHTEFGGILRKFNFFIKLWHFSLFELVIPFMVLKHIKCIVSTILVMKCMKYVRKADMVLKYLIFSKKTVNGQNDN